MRRIGNNNNDNTETDRNPGDSAFECIVIDEKNLKSALEEEGYGNGNCDYLGLFWGLILAFSPSYF